MADIVIREMEMPDGCHNCGFSYFDKGETNGGELCTVLMCSAMNQGTNGAEYDGNRPFWCPLVPLPEGHGRLIDAEAYVDYMQNRYDNNEITNGDWIDFRLSLKDQPTIVPAEGGTENG